MAANEKTAHLEHLDDDPFLGGDHPEEAWHAARAGWERFERKLPGDADGDGR